MVITVEIYKQIDKLGRLLIPIDLRKAYGFKEGDIVYLKPQDDGILLRPKGGYCEQDKRF